MNKYKWLIHVFFALAFLFTIRVADSKGQTTELFEPFSELFTSPLGLEFAHNEPEHVYLVERAGRIKQLNVQNPEQESTLWLNISERIESEGEGGLLGLAFHPDYPSNNSFYINYTIIDTEGQMFTRISKFKAPGGVSDMGSEDILLEIEQPQDNHNGGQLAFGPDGYLYIALGDGGRDSRFNSQNTQNLYGSILRIDVNVSEGYSIPDDNPFVGSDEGLDEIYAWGFRNPWRMSFDPETGYLWVADVGQQEWETIYIVEKGKNYGWPVIEGRECYIYETCDKENLEMPLYEYPWEWDGLGRSITGGYVYRGNDNPSLYGKYIYGDFISGRIWALELDHDKKEVLSNKEIFSADFKIPSFGIDSNGEIYTLRFQGDFSRVYRFVPELTLTTLFLKSLDGSSAVQLNWEVNSDSGVDSFELFRGSSMDNMELYDTIGGDNRQFSDPAPLNGATFYAVRAVNTDGNAGELSNPVSFYRAQETLSDSWQLTSIPFETEGVNVSDAIIYRFDGSYIAEDQLLPGRGYWARSTVEGGIEFAGEGAGLQTATMQLEEGWNLIGAPVSTIPAESIIDESSILSSTPIYGFNGTNLSETESISPGQGYWIYAVKDGAITLDLEFEPLSLPLITANTSHKNYSDEFDTFVFSSKNSSAEMYAAKGAVSPDLKNRFRVPPISPSPVLDVRTADGFKLVESGHFELDITATEYPLTVRFIPAENKNNFKSTDFGDAYEVRLWQDGVPESSILNSETTLTLSEPVDRIEFLRVEGRDEVVRETELLPSYPNPFNPVTTISYRLSEQQQVTLTVFDAAGRRIATLVDSEQDTGQYTLPFDASGLASGIYFVRFSAGDVLSTQKLTLIK